MPGGFKAQHRLCTAHANNVEKYHISSRRSVCQITFAATSLESHCQHDIIILEAGESGRAAGQEESW